MIELHAAATANGFKAAIMLEEAGESYDVIKCDLVRGDQHRPDFLALNPAGRIPLIVDHDAALAEPLPVYGSVAILLYLAEKTGRLMSDLPATRAKVYEWLGVVSSDLGTAYAGQFAFTVLAPERMPWAVNYFEQQCLRFMKVLDQGLARSRYLAGASYTVADVCAYPVAAVSAARYPGSLESFPNIQRWSAEVGSREAVARGMDLARRIK